jgi:hypothetical protein
MLDALMDARYAHGCHHEEKRFDDVEQLNLNQELIMHTVLRQDDGCRNLSDKIIKKGLLIYCLHTQQPIGLIL